MLLTRRDIFAVYNTGAALMKWETRTEEKFHALLRLKFRPARQIRAILLGTDMDAALSVLESTGGARRRYLMIDESYEHLHFIPFDTNGDMLLRILSNPELWEDTRQLLSADMQPAPNSFIDCDGKDAEGNPVLLGFDFDLCRIKKFCAGLTLRSLQGVILCFDFQADAFKKYCPPAVSLKTIDTQKFKTLFSI